MGMGTPKFQNLVKFAVSFVGEGAMRSTDQGEIT